MNRWHAFGQIFLARLREFFREPEALFWVYGFPLLLAVGLGLAFSSREPEPPTVDIQGQPGDTAVESLRQYLQEKGVKVQVVDSPQLSQERLANGEVALAVELTGKTVRYHYDRDRAESVLALHWVDALLARRDNPNLPPPQLEPMVAAGQRYIDFVLPGLMGLNIMGGGLWGVGFVLVDMRIRKLLKRLLATPMRRDDFLLAILCARLVFLLPDMGVLLLGGWLFFGVPIRGNPLELLVVIVVGASAFAGIGLLVACRAEKMETVSGLMNLVMLPMWLLSGTFFSANRFPEVMQPFVQALPLTQLNYALREVMLHGAGLQQVAWRLAILLGYAVVTFWLALKLFRWR